MTNNDIATRSNGDDMHSVIADHYQGINEALHERDRLQALATDLQNELTVARKLIDHHTNTLEILTKDRDFYYRKAHAFESQLRNMRGMLDGVLSLVEFEATNSPVKAPEMPKAANIDELEGA